MTIPTDPVLSEQWHLIQTAPGLLDLNVLGVWNPSEGLSYTGAGTRTVVIDNGFDYTNPDFDNYNQAMDYDYALGTNDPFGTSTDSHGTAVAGIIGAAADGSGAVGVAYGTELVGYRTLGLISNAWLGNIRDSIHDAAGIDADQVNISQGIANDSSSVFRIGYDPTLFAAIETSIGYAVSNGRGGLGTTIVKSAGNSRSANYDANADDWTNDTRQVVVAAVNQDGFVSFYSSYGAPVLVSAFGTPGEVVTTDRTGAAGYEAGDITHTFNGTSAAAPMVTGVVALINEANPGLGWRDIQSILSASARHVGSAVGAIVADAERYAWGFNGANTWNGGGMHFSNDYGYGLVDATAAVRLAETWLITGTSAATSANEVTNTISVLNAPTPIPDGNLTGLSFTATNAVNDVAERVTVTVNFSTTYLSDVRIYLTSPSGTVSELTKDVGAGADFNGTYTFESQAFRGETTAGVWTVKVIDDTSSDPLTVNSISINTYSNDTVDDRYIFTNEYSDYAGLFGHTQAIVDTNGGEDTVNAAAVTSASTIYLDGFYASTIDGISVNLTNIENAIGGDGADTIDGTGGANKLFGGRGNDLLYGEQGNDSLNGGSGNDYLNGGIDADMMAGGAGNDTYVVDNLGDTIVENAGEGTTDLVQTRVSFVLAADDDIEVLSAYLASDTTSLVLTGNDLAQTITGNAGANVLVGLGGADVLNGYEGGDTLIGGNGADTLDGGTGIDTLIGGTDSDIYIIDNPYDTVVEIAGDGSADQVLASVSYLLAAAADIEQLATTQQSGTDAINLTGNDLNQTISGNAGTNFLTGLGGADTIYGYGGADTLDGGSGTDYLDGGTGADTLIGGSDNDYYVVDNAGDIIVEGVGGGSADYVAASVSFALAADDDIEFMTTVLPSATDAINLTGNDLAQTISGNAGANVLNGGSGADILYGLAGVDTLIGGVGADTLIGGTGSDFYYIDNAGDVIVENAGEGTADRVVTSVSFALAADDDIEQMQTFVPAGTTAINLTGNDLAQTINGNAGANVLTGLGGADVLNGFDGADTLNGGSGADTLNGGTGADTLIGGADSDFYFVDNAGDIIVETAGGGTADRVVASASYVLAAGADIEQMVTAVPAGVDAINLTGNDLAQTISGNNGANVLSGLGGADVLNGFDGADTLNGGSGVDTLIGGTGADTLIGGADSDFYFVDNAGDIIVETAGGGTADRVVASVSFALAADDDIEQMQTFAPAGTDAINLTGNDFAQTISGNAGANVLNGGSGADTLYGFAGVDTLIGGVGVDTLVGGADSDYYFVENAADIIVENAGEGTADRVVASVSFALAADDDIELMQTFVPAGTTAINLTGNGLAQTINGNAGANVLSGLGGADVLNGFDGADTLIGGAGLDILTGGGGADRFQFGAAVAGNGDRIVDFVTGLDKLVFTAADYGLAAGALSAANFTLGSAAVGGAAQFIYNSVAKTLSWDSDGTGLAAATLVATFDTAVGLSTADFILV